MEFFRLVDWHLVGDFPCKGIVFITNNFCKLKCNDAKMLDLLKKILAASSHLILLIGV